MIFLSHLNQIGDYEMNVYIILTDTGTLFTRIIKLFTRHPLNHVSVSFTRKLDETYSFGRKRPKNPFIGGFVREDMNGSLFRHADCAIYCCSVSEYHYNRMKMLIKQIEVQQQLYKYNLIGLFGVLFNKRWDREKAFFCSEFVATVLYHGGIFIENKPPSLVKPHDFVVNPELQLVYEGPLNAYLLAQSPDTVCEVKRQRRNCLSYLSAIRQKFAKHAS